MILENLLNSQSSSLKKLPRNPFHHNLSSVKNCAEAEKCNVEQKSYYILFCLHILRIRDQVKIPELSRRERGARSGSQVEETEFQTVPGYNFPSNPIYRYLTQEIGPGSESALSQTHKLRPFFSSQAINGAVRQVAVGAK